MNSLKTTLMQKKWLILISVVSIFVVLAIYFFPDLVLAFVSICAKCFILISAVSAAFFAFILLIPLRFNLNLRGSIKGQKAEIWFVYLFRIFKIGVVATPHTQDVVLKLFGWKKILQRNTRRKPEKKPTKPDQNDSMPGNELKPIEEVPQPITEISEKEVPVEAELKTKTEPPPQTESIVSVDESRESSIPPITKVKPEIEVTEAPLIEPEKIIEKPSTIESRAQESASEKIDVEPLKPVSELDPFARTSKETDKEGSSEKPPEKKAEESLNQKLRNIRKLLSEKYRLGKKWLKVIMRKYQLLSPVFWKFWGRSKKGFRIENPTIGCRYALHEPYLTGMFQGNLAIFSGILQRFGINFVPVPVFSSPTLYAKANASAVLLPWRFVFALLGLVFEKLLWTEAWKLFKWYRASKYNK